jgi:hypothetical protein
LPAAELRRTAIQRAPLVALILLVAAGAAGLLTTPAPADPPTISTVYYYDQGAYHMVVLASDPAGTPESQVHLRSTPSWSVPPGTSLDAASGASGLLNLTFPTAVELNGSVTITASGPGGSSTVTTQISPGWPLPSEGTVSEGSNDILAVRSGAYQATGELLVFFAGPNGTLPTGYSVQWGFEQLDLNGAPLHPGSRPYPVLSTPQTEPVQHYYTLTSLRSYDVVLPLHLSPAPAGLGPDLSVSVLNMSGTLVSEQAFAPVAFGTIGGLATAGVDAQAALAPLLVIGGAAGLLLGLGAYGMDRTSGALDVYLARPVTPRGLLMARFLGLLVPLEVGIAGGIASLDLALWARFGAPMPPGLLLVVLLSSFGSVAGLLAAAVAASEMARTPVRLLTVILSLLVLFGFLWSPILTTVAPLIGAGPGTSAASRFLLLGAVLDPMQTAPALVPLAVEGTDLAAVVLVVVVGAAWLAGPILAATREAGGPE